MIVLIVVMSLMIVFGLGVTIFLLINDRNLGKNNKYNTQSVKGAVRAMDKRRIVSLSDIERMRNKLPKFVYGKK